MTGFVDEHIHLFVLYGVSVLLLLLTNTVFLPMLTGKLTHMVSNTEPKPLRQTTVVVLGLLGLYALVLVFSFLRTYSVNWLEPEMLRYQRDVLYKRIVYHYGENFSEPNAAELYSLLSSVPIRRRRWLNLILADVVPTGVLLVTSTVFLFTQNVYLGIPMLVGLGLIFTVGYFQGESVLVHAEAVERSWRVRSANYINRFENLVNVYINGLTEEEVQDHVEDNQTYTALYHKTMMSSTATNSVSNILVYGMVATLLMLALHLWRRSILTSDKLLVVILSVGFTANFLFRSLSNLPVLLATSGYVAADKVRLNELFCSELGSDFAIHNRHTDVTSWSIAFEKVTFGYKVGPPVLREFSLNVPNQHFVALVGRSGSGKTTLVKLLLKLYSPAAGRILLGGVDIQDLSSVYVRENVYYVNQRTLLKNQSVLDNIIFGGNSSEAEVVSILSKYSIDVFDHLKDGLHTDVGIGGNHLSAGMQKIIIVLRAIFKRRRVYVFDEPMAGLDAKTRCKVVSLLRQECNQCTVLIITHDKEIIPMCHSVFNLQDLNCSEPTAIACNSQP